MVWRALLAAAGFVLALLPADGWAQGCHPSRRVDFTQGMQTCLDDYPFVRRAPVGQQQPLDALLPRTGYFVLAAPVGPSCPVTIALGVPQQFLGPPRTAAVEQAVAQAREECRAAVSRSGSNPGCQCEIVFNQGFSAMSRTEFDTLFAEQPAAASTPAPRVNAPAASAAPTSPVASPADGPATNRDDLLASLQKRLAELEAARASAPAAGIAPVPRLSARALVIGNSRYVSFGALPNPGRDARAIAAKLRGFGIEVDLLLDAERDDLIHALNEHARRAAGHDVSILYYAGHGVQVEGVNYLIPVNMRADGITTGYVKLAGISLNAALDYLPARMRLVFLDACRDNPATRSLVMATRGGARAGLAPVHAASGTLVSYATRDGSTADDGEGEHSPYTAALLRHLDAPADISLVLRQVRQTVLQLTGGRQEPWEYGSLVGEQIVLPLMAR